MISRGGCIWWYFPSKPRLSPALCVLLWPPELRVFIVSASISFISLWPPYQIKGRFSSGVSFNRRREINGSILGIYALIFPKCSSVSIGPSLPRACFMLWFLSFLNHSRADISNQQCCVSPFALSAQALAIFGTSRNSNARENKKWWGLFRPFAFASISPLFLSRCLSFSPGWLKPKHTEFFSLFSH